MSICLDGYLQGLEHEIVSMIFGFYHVKIPELIAVHKVKIDISCYTSPWFTVYDFLHLVFTLAFFPFLIHFIVFYSFFFFFFLLFFSILADGHCCKFSLRSCSLFGHPNSIASHRIEGSLFQLISRFNLCFLHFFMEVVTKSTMQCASCK